MLKLWITLRDLLSREDGQDLVEYALIISGIALGALAGVETFGNAVSGVWASIVAQVVPVL